ncbi:MAG: hypothetical protein ACIAS6_13055 [Phycisphaerales bacterium JB060]
MPERQPTSQPAIDALAELRRAPRRVMLRAIERLEDAANQIDTTAALPAGWFLSTASGYDIHVAGRVPGEVALADACVLIESLCAAANVLPDELPPGCLGVKELAAKWNVAQRTLHRYRKKGLPARSVREGRTRRLAFTPAAVSAYEARHDEAIKEARTFTRLSESDRQNAIHRASELQSQGATANAAARLVAEELGRSHEAIRQLLTRASGGSSAWTDRQKRLALRVHDRFVEPADIADRLGRDTGATRRIIDAARLARLQDLDLETTELSEPPAPRPPLGAPGPTLLADLVAEMRDATVPDRASEHAITSYARYLTTRAARTISQERAASLRAEPIDAAETDLLWAARLRVEALRPLLGIVLRGIEARLGDEIESLPARQATTRLQLALAAAAEAAHRYDPARGGRLSGAVSIAVDRAAGDAPQPGPKASSARRSFAQSHIDDWTRRVSPWQSFLDAPTALRRGIYSLAQQQRALLEARFGLGERPQTLTELADRFGIHRPWIARRVREAARSALAAGRDTMTP